MFACRVSLNYVMAGPTRTPMRLMSLFVCFRLSGRPGGNPTGWAGRPAFAVPFGIPSLRRHSPSRCCCHRCHWHHQLRRAPCCNQVNRVWRCKMGCGVCGGVCGGGHQLVSTTREQNGPAYMYPFIALCLMIDLTYPPLRLHAQIQSITVTVYTHVTGV